MRESIRRELWTWAQYLAVGSLANFGALAWNIKRAGGDDLPWRWAGTMRQWSETYFASWLVLFVVFSLVRIIIVFFMGVRMRDREQSISRRSW